MRLKPIAIDGTTLEGGGQLFRLAIALSCLTGKPIQLSKIRGNRQKGSKPGGGLKSVHLAGLAWLTKATRANVEGACLGSANVFLDPQGDIVEGSTKHDAMWKQINKAGINIKLSEHSYESTIEIHTPGSILLIIQAILPFILFRWNGPREKPVRLRVHGGTNVWNSLSYDYAEQVLFPVLRQHLGIGPIEMELVRRGWSTGRANVGEVIFTVPPLPERTKLPAFHLKDRGEITKLEAYLVSPADRDNWWSRSIVEELQKQCGKKIPGVELTIRRDEEVHEGGKLYLMLVAHTSNAYRLARDLLYSKSFKKAHTNIVKELVQTVVDDLKKELDQNSCVDEYLQDQLVVFQALVEGRSTIQGVMPGSLHTQTARWVAEQVTGITFDEDGTCEGIGLSASRGHTT